MSFLNLASPAAESAQTLKACESAASPSERAFEDVAMDEVAGAASGSEDEMTDTMSYGSMSQPSTDTSGTSQSTDISDRDVEDRRLPDTHSPPSAQDHPALPAPTAPTSLARDIPHHLPLLDHGSRPASRSELLPSIDQYLDNSDIVNGTTFRTLTGSVVAALASTPSLARPFMLPLSDDFGAPEELTATERTAFMAFLDAVASVCVQEDGEAHAVAWTVSAGGDACSLLHAVDAPPTRRSDVWRTMDQAAQGAFWDAHLQTTWQLLRRTSYDSSQESRDDLLVYLYRWCWSALHSRFHRTAQVVVDGLRKILDRAFTKAEIVQHPQPRRFHCAFTHGEFAHLEETCASLSALLPTITPEVPADRASILAIHRHMVTVLNLWSRVVHREVDDNLLGYLLDRILLLPIRSFLRDITCIPWVCEVLADTAHDFRHRLRGSLTVVHVPNDSSTFLGNMEHQSIVSIVPREDSKTRSFEEDWRTWVLGPLLSRFGLPSRFSTHAEVHCECSLLKFIETHPLDRLYRFIGLSQPPCLPCSELFGLYNVRGDELAMDSADLDGPDEIVFWSPLRTRCTDRHVSLPWVAPRMDLDSDGRISLQLQAILFADFKSAWRYNTFNLDDHWKSLPGWIDYSKGALLPEYVAHELTVL